MSSPTCPALPTEPTSQASLPSRKEKQLSWAGTRPRPLGLRGRGRLRPGTVGSGRTPSEGRPFGPGGPQARQGLWPPHRVFLWPKSPSATSGTRPWGVSGSVAHPHSRACSTPSSEDTSHPPPPATKLTPSALCQGLLSGPTDPWRAGPCPWPQVTALTPPYGEA